MKSNDSNEGEEDEQPKRQLRAKVQPAAAAKNAKPVLFKDPGAVPVKGAA